MNKKKTIVYSSLGALTTGVVIAIPIVFTVNFEKEKNNELISNFINEKSNKLEIFPDRFEYTVNDPELGIENLKITESPLNGNYFLSSSQNGLAQLWDAIKTRGVYTSELNQLNNIIINDPNIKVPNTLGFYIPGTRNIYIRTLFQENVLKQNGYSTNNIITNNNLKSVPLDIKLELIFETFTHEYNHHLANIYANSLQNDDPNVSKDIFRNDLDKHTSSQETWNKSFVDAFKQNFRYDKIFDNLISSDKSNVNQNIGSIYSASELFSIANEDNSSIFTEILKNPNKDNNAFILQSLYKKSIFPLLKYRTSQGLSLNGLTYAQQMPYYYSLAELFTRKLMLLSFKPNYDISVPYSSVGFKFSPLVNNYYLSVLASDFMHSQAIQSNVDDIIPIGNAFLADAAYGAKMNVGNKEYNLIDQTQQIYQMYLKLINYGQSISTIYTKANFNITYPNQKNFNIRQNIYENSIKFSGYIPKDSQITHVVYQDNNNNLQKIALSVNPNFNFNFYKSISQRDDVTNLLKPDKLYDSYTLSSFINANHINPHFALKFWSDKNNDTKITDDELIQMNNFNSENTISTYRKGVNTANTYYIDSSYRLIKKS